MDLDSTASLPYFQLNVRIVCIFRDGTACGHMFIGSEDGCVRLRQMMCHMFDFLSRRRRSLLD